MGKESRMGSFEKAISTLVLAGLLASCVKINTQTNYAETFVEERSAVQAVSGSLQIHPTGSLDGTTLAVVLKQDERCRTVVTPVYRKSAHHVREPEAKTLFRPLYVGLYGVVALGAGAALYIGADDLAADSMGNQPSDYRNGGIALGAIGVGLLALATVDQIRLRDTHEDLGVVEHEPKVSEDVCRGRAVASEQVSLAIGKGVDWLAKGTTDANGSVRFALVDIPEAAFSNEGMHLELNVRGTSVPLELPESDKGPLLAALVADPNSRVVHDREARAKAVCDAGVSAAREAQRDIKAKPDDSTATWKSAKTACAKDWNEDRERELVQAVALARDAHIEMDGREFEAALGTIIAKDDVSIDELKRAEKLLAALGGLSPPDPQLEKRTKKLETTRRRALDTLVGLANRQVSRGDLDAAKASLEKAEAISPNDARLDRIGHAIVAKIDAQAKREEAERARKEGPYWHLQVICAGYEKDSTWQRGRSGDDAKRKVCVARCPTRDDGSPQRWCMDKCLNGSGDGVCEWRATKVKCHGCE